MLINLTIIAVLNMTGCPEKHEFFTQCRSKSIWNYIQNVVIILRAQIVYINCHVRVIAATRIQPVVNEAAFKTMHCRDIPPSRVLLSIVEPQRKEPPCQIGGY